MKPAIRIEGLSKLYHLGRQRDPHQTLRETLTQAFQDRWNGVAALFRNDDEAAGDDGPTTLWALKSVTFDIQPGEVVGIIGRNGAGKSTLLKIISRITEPTSGRIRLRGRVRSLLEVGTGFHPELTGRENIFLNGAILGMSRAEIVSKFDEIVAFSEIEKFLDTPVKRYSSGMYVRLAFGVAAHLEPEILIVDEVLAVGDAQFQRKCLGKMEEVATRGRTVLFVSHQLDAVQRLCNQVAYLERGHLKGYGPTRQIVAQYLAHGPQNVQPGRWLNGYGKFAPRALHCGPVLQRVCPSQWPSLLRWPTQRDTRH
jgi:lipopolysaccharide transport system ATP-binding protein